MPTMNTKNFPLSPVGQELGLGTDLATQMQDRLAEEAKRKKLLGLGATSTAAQDLGLAPLTLGSAILQ